MHDTFSGAYEGIEQHWWFLLAAKTLPICIVFRFFWGGCGGDQDNETSCCHPSQCYDENHCFWQHTVPKLWENIFCWCLCSSICKWGKHWVQYLYPKFSISWITLCPIPVSVAIVVTFTCHFSLMNSSVFSFVSLNRGSLLVTTVGLTGDACVPVFKMFIHSLTLLHLCWLPCICMLTSCMHVQRGDLLLNQKFYHCILQEQNFLASHYLALKWDHVPGHVTWYWFWREMVVGMCYNISGIPKLPGICSLITQCLWLLARPFFFSGVGEGVFGEIMAQQKWDMKLNQLQSFISVYCYVSKHVTLPLVC